MITLNIARIATIKGIQRPYTFLVKQGFSPQMAKTMLSGRAQSLHFAYLERLCRIFRCEPYDLFDYRPHYDMLSSSTDHLAFLTKPAEVKDLRSLLANLSVKEMEALAADVAKRSQAV